MINIVIISWTLAALESDLYWRNNYIALLQVYLESWIFMVKLLRSPGRVLR